MTAPVADARAETHVVVDPALRALYHARRRGASPEARAPAACPRPEAGDASASVGTLPWRRFRLRRDGMRPLVFDGMLLLSRCQDTEIAAGAARLRHLFEVYLARDGGLVMRLALLVPGGCPARPVHSVVRLEEGEALSPPLGTHDPARGLAARSDPDGPPPDMAVAERLRTAARCLVTAARRAAPTALTSKGD